MSVGKQGAAGADTTLVLQKLCFIFDPALPERGEMPPWIDAAIGPALLRGICFAIFTYYFESHSLDGA